MIDTTRAVIHGSLSEIPREKWNALLSERSTPFMKWEWLSALEESGCLSDHLGWAPHHIAIYRGDELVAAAPAYLRDNSDGDFSQDWGWAEAAARGRVPYYPKLSITVPFTPVSGERFLIGKGEDRRSCIESILETAKQSGSASFQVLFMREEESTEAAGHGWFTRRNFQFHWKNEGYTTFDDFLSRFSSKKRNQLKRERRAPAEQGISIRTVRHDEIAKDPDFWASTVHGIHRSTLEKLFWGRKWLNLTFYESIFRSMADYLEVVLAEKDGRIIGGAFNVATPDHLYGRYWGCFEEHPFLHFNVCMYHSIEECIRLGRKSFEGGAGGQHKLVRGFEPAETFSAHYFPDHRLGSAVKAAVAAENQALELSLGNWRKESPILRHP